MSRYGEFQDWYVNTEKRSLNSANQYLVAFRKVSFKQSGETVEDIFNPEELENRVNSILETKGTDENIIRSTFDVTDGNLQFDDLKSGLKYYLKFLKLSVSLNMLDSDFINFKHVLGYFVHIMLANNKTNPEQFVNSEPKSGQGYAGNRIRQSYEKYRSYSTGMTMDVNIVPGFQLYTKTCYINWTPTGMNVRVQWNQQKDNIESLQLFNNEEKNGVWVGEPIPLDSFNLYDEKEPNQVVKNFYQQYVQMLNNSRYMKNKEVPNNMKVKQLSEMLVEGKAYNIILRGAPGTGKTYLSKQIAADIIGCLIDELSDCDQFDFVQFHPSYDYTDFVAGLRPVQGNDGQVGFEPKNGIFKAFCEKAKFQQEKYSDTFDDIWENFIINVEEESTVIIPRIANGQDLTYSVNSNRNLKEGNSVASITKENIFRVWQGNNGRKSGGQQAKMQAVVNYLKNKYSLPDYNASFATNGEKTDKKFVFVIDEINRAEISKVLGELFFAIDPEYRGKYGAVSTQYSNLFEDEEKFYIPENVYIIGTMNDIDRSVDTFDFAMRRRFTFVEVTAKDSQETMLKNPDVIARMDALNEKIISDEIGLSEDWEIGASYFRALEDESRNISVESLWINKLEPLLKDYFRGERNCKAKIENLKSAYDLVGDDDGSVV
ncbi:AAA family ATPase [Leuconostoc pseudomesenteroides]|uniref:AAA family ATPase n=1 Tax=Leuconostoc pseudomesenteroides TaxID=33968 RepID=UPI001664CBC1|nr:AAA family ATPase [Leuconostoc pseudomesenteroides]MBS0957486.1 AAA family ATPase [Leuconostoc pseudomesenteroides]